MNLKYYPKPKIKVFTGTLLEQIQESFHMEKFNKYIHDGSIYTYDTTNHLCVYIFPIEQIVEYLI